MAGKAHPRRRRRRCECENTRYGTFSVEWIAVIQMGLAWPRVGCCQVTSSQASKEDHAAPGNVCYPPQYSMMAFCSSVTLEYPRTAAAAFSPPYCRASAATLWPSQLGVPGMPANFGSDFAG